MRVGASEIALSGASLIGKIYDRKQIRERHRHRFKVNPKFKQELEAEGLKFSAFGPQNEIEAIELQGHPFFLGTQFHPEFTSRILAPSPVFVAFLKAAICGNPGLAKK